MRAIVVDEFGPPEALRVRDAAMPAPGPGEVLVEIHAAPVNYVDILVVGGKYQFLPPRPFIPGKSPSGIVRALGPPGARHDESARRRPRPGDGRDRRLCRSGFRRRRAVPPPAAGHVVSASGVSRRCLRYLLVALRSRARLIPARRFWCSAPRAGSAMPRSSLPGVGARILGGIARPEREKLARAAGADAIIDLSRPNLRDSLREQVYAETDGRGVDVIIDPLGGDLSRRRSGRSPGAEGWS